MLSKLIRLVSVAVVLVNSTWTLSADGCDSWSIEMCDGCAYTTEYCGGQPQRVYGYDLAAGCCSHQE